MNELPRTQALRCFITVAREGTVSRAASLLNLTQPAVSLQLKGLEESTGLQLFNRTPGGFTLTEAGAASRFLIAEDRGVPASWHE